MTRRLFLAIAPDSEQVTPLASLQQQLSAIGRPVRLANLHMTMFFIGHCSHEISNAIITAIDNLSLPRFKVSLTTLELWQKPKIICLAGIADDPKLAHMIINLRQIAANVGLPPDPHLYRPHITLIRKAKTLPLLTPLQGLTLQPQQLHLYHSVSIPMEVQYHIIISWPLL